MIGCGVLTEPGRGLRGPLRWCFQVPVTRLPWAVVFLFHDVELAHSALFVSGARRRDRQLYHAVLTPGLVFLS